MEGWIKVSPAAGGSLLLRKSDVVTVGEDDDKTILVYDSKGDRIPLKVTENLDMILIQLRHQ